MSYSSSDPGEAQCTAPTSAGEAQRGALSSAEVREAQRAARKQKILSNKDRRMTRVKGEYNQHRVATNDSDDDDDSEFFHASREESQLTVTL